MITKWVLIDETGGAKTGDGSSLDPATLTRIASACEAQLNQEFARFYGGQYEVRAGTSSTDVFAGERVYAFLPTLAQAPGASAYHDIDGNGVPVSYCAVTTCSSLLGPSGVSVDASHELMEAAADPSCNILADNLAGLLVAYEVCDPVEVQTYASHIDGGVQVSNFVLPSWFDPKSPAPYDFMSYAQIAGAVAPHGPMQIAPGNGGNYVITETSTENETDTFGIRGTPRKGSPNFTGGRYMRRLMGRQVSLRGKLRLPAPPAPPQKVADIPPPPPIVAAHVPPGTVERVGMHKKTPPTRPAPRLSVSQQRIAAIDAETPSMAGIQAGVGPRELSAAGVQAAQKFLTRPEVRSRQTTSGQHDPQQAVLAGRKRIRDEKSR